MHIVALFTFFGGIILEWVGLTQLKKAEASEGLRKLLLDPVLYVSHDIRIGIVLAVIGLMVFKPAPVGIVLWLVAAMLIALALRLNSRRSGTATSPQGSRGATG